MFSRNFLELIVLMLFVGVLSGQWALSLLCLLALLTAGTAQLWRRWASYRLEYQRELNVDHTFPGEEVLLTARLTNRKLLPLARVDIHDMLVPGLELHDGAVIPYGQAGKRAIFRSLSMGWYESSSWRYRLHCPQRGLYRIGPVHLRTGDPFGIFHDEYTQPEITRLVVYPRLLPAEELGLDMRQLLGTLRSQQQLVVDPVRTAGIRDYHRDDPLKSIHWAATARRGALQTRVYEPITSLELVCFLDVDTFEHYWEGVLRDEVERLISTTATICKRLVEAGHSVGLFTNSAVPEQRHLMRLAPGRSPRQLALLLEALAVLSPYSAMPMSRLLYHAPPLLSPGATVLLISSTASEELRATLLRLQQHGHPASWIYLGEQTQQLPGVRVFHTPRPARWSAPQEVLP